jgi:putative endonuclease
MEENYNPGKEGEEIARKLLEDRGYEIIETNYRFGKGGEIDIIAKAPDGYLVFTEVKLRTSLKYGLPEYAITKGKQNQIKKLAAAYLYIRNINDQPCRFDVVCILKLPFREAEITHYIDAFR